MSIPLPIRKNIRDNEAVGKESLERLAKVTGKEFELEVDWGAVISQLEAGWARDSIGETYQKEVLRFIVDNIENLCKNEMAKESFVEATSANKIIIRVNDKISTYWKVSFVDGAVLLEHKKSLANLYEISNFNLIAIMPTPGLPLAARMNLEQYKERLEESLQKINDLTGASDWSLEVDFEKIIPQLPEYNKNTVGELYYKDVMDYLVRNLEDALKSETTKESFNEATSQHKIVVEINPKLSTYWEIKFNDGNLTVSHKKDVANLYEIGNLSLVDRIPSPGLPLATRLNVEKHRPDLDEKLEKIGELTGSNDWSLEVDFEKLIKANNYYLKSAGELYYKEVMEYLVRNLEELLKNETTKEAFNEATSQHKIIIRVTENPKETIYWKIFFENGSLVLQHRKDCANLYEIGNFNIAAVTPVPGVLSLLARLNIQSHQENLQEQLEIIKAATGEDYSFDDSCLEACYKAVDEYGKNRVGETFMKEALGYLASNLKSALADDMVKEAFNETATAHQITFRPDAKLSTYWGIKFENGVVVVLFKPSVANMYELGNFSIEKLL